MITKKNTITILLIGSFALVTATTWSVFANGYEQNVQWGNDLTWSPAGGWIISIPTPMGAMLMMHNQSALDLAGTRFGGSMFQVNENPTNFGAFPEGDRFSHWITQTIRTGPDTLETTMIGYITKKRENAMDELLAFDVINATWSMTGPDAKEGVATMSTYLASQDADQDGFPDEGQEPLACTPFAFTGRRLRVMPGCVPASLPEPPGQ